MTQTWTKKDTVAVVGVIAVMVTLLGAAIALFLCFGRGYPGASWSSQAWRAFIGDFIPLVIVVAIAAAILDLLSPQQQQQELRRR